MGLTDLIPKIEGFAPLPSASADAFMSMQGGHMALYFGAYYTIGKRSMAKLTNEEFNLAMEEPSRFTNILEPHTNEITNAFEKYLSTHVDRIQEKVLDKAYDLEILKIHQNVKLLKELPATYWEALTSALGQLSTGGPTQTSYSGQATLQQVRLSQGSQESQRDRELYLGGESAKSLYQRDLDRIAEQNRQNARALNLQRQHNEAVRARNQILAEKSRQLSPKISTVHQTALQASRTTLLRPAGQTQKLERTRLTKLIQAEANAYKQAKARLTKFSQSNTALKKIGIEVSPPSLANIRATASRSMLLATQRLKKTQTLLNGLIARYRWS